MRILYLTQYFPPEIGATQTRAYEMARGLVKQGHEVTLLTEFPNHPVGIIPPEYQGKWYEKADLEGIEVLRLWVKASPHKSFRTRILFYLSYMFMAIWAGLFLVRGKYDVIYATSPPLFTGAAGLVLSVLKRTPLVFEVRDLWPESAVQLGELNNSLAIRLSEWLEHLCYRRAVKMVAVTKGIKESLVRRGYADEDIALIPNGANTELYVPQETAHPIRQQLGIPLDNFVVVYTGLHGLAHGLETVVDTADILRDQTDISFLLVGNGPRKADLIELAAAKGLSTITFQEAVPEIELPAYIAASDIGLDSRRRIGISHGTLPVKMFSYMACARPVLLAIEGEAADLLENAQAGVAVPMEDAPALAAAILKLKANPEQ
ncbi:MAG: glycosyltransferase family 4 protein, partial [Anaerolineales bacterium]|nr:glycosyltransferase family 4 protein [Anaerolineales bacterium]